MDQVIKMLRDAVQRKLKASCRCSRPHHSTNAGCELYLSDVALRKALAASSKKYG